MKGLWLLFVIAVICSADLEAAANIGQSCESKSPFVVTSFTANPYPPSSGVQINLVMAGTFTQSQYVSDIVIRTKFNAGKFSSKYIDIGQNFAYGQVYTFTFTTTAGTEAGLYDIEVGLEKSQGSAVSCWTFSYHI
jgi:hypothetical protein